MATLLQYRGFPLSEAKNVLVTPVGTKIFVPLMETFSIVSLIWRGCKERLDRIYWWIKYWRFYPKIANRLNLPLANILSYMLFILISVSIY